MLFKCNCNIYGVSTGACQCQIMDRVIPGSVDMSKVKFDAQCENDYRHNFSLLRHAFKKNNITKVSAHCLISDVSNCSVSSTYVTRLPISAFRPSQSRIS